MKDVVPAALFIGELVRVTTNLQREISSEELDDEGFTSQETETVSVILLGTILDSDETYLSLGIINDDGIPLPKAALKHSDIKLIEVYEEGDDILEQASQIDDSLIN